MFHTNTLEHINNLDSTNNDCREPNCLAAHPQNSLWAVTMCDGSKMAGGHGTEVCGSRPFGTST